MKLIAVIFVANTLLIAQSRSSDPANLQVHTGDCSVSVVNNGSGQVNIIAPSSCGKIPKELQDYLRVQSPETVKYLNRLLKQQDVTLANAEGTIQKLQAEVARQQDIALAGKLAAEAGTLVMESPQLSALLSIESIRRAKFLENDRSLRRALPLLDNGNPFLVSGNKSVYVFRPRFTLTGGVIATPNDRNVLLLDPEHRALVVQLNQKLSDMTPSAPPESDRNSPSYIALLNSYSLMYNTFQKQMTSELDISANGAYIARGGGDGIVRVFDSQSGVKIAEIDNPSAIRTISLSPQGEFVAAGLDDGTVRIFDVKSGKLKAQFRIEDGQLSSRSVAFNADGTYMYVFPRLGKTIKIVATANFDTIHDLTFDEELWAASLLPGGHEIVISTQTALRDLAIPTMQEKWRDPIEKGACCAFDLTASFDGRHLAATGLGVGTKVYDLKNGDLIHDFRSRDGEGAGRVVPWRSVPAAFSHDGSYVAIANPDDSISLIDLSTGEETSNLIDEDIYDIYLLSEMQLVTKFPDGENHRATRRGLGRVIEFQFAPDDRRLVAAFQFHPNESTVQSGKTQLFDTENLVSQFLVRSEDIISEACSHLKANLTLTSWKQYFGDEPYHKTCNNLP